MRLDRLPIVELTQAFFPSGYSTSVPELLNIDVVIGACKLIDGCRAVFNHTFSGII